MNIREKEILALNEPEKSFWYCICNRNADIKAHEKVILDSKNITYCYEFAVHFPITNLKLLEQIIIDSVDINYCYYFAKTIKELNKQLLFEAVLSSGNLPWIKSFYKNIDFDKTKYETLMLFI